VVTVGRRRGDLSEQDRLPVIAGKSYDQASAADFDGVVVPGGYAADHIRRYPKAIQFIAEMNAQGKLVASICHGLWALCSAGMLRGRRATCFFAIKDDVVNAARSTRTRKWCGRQPGHLAQARRSAGVLPACIRVLTA